MLDKAQLQLVTLVVNNIGTHVRRLVGFTRNWVTNSAWDMLNSVLFSVRTKGELLRENGRAY
jgi:hypothetical protein